jgi:hypothetical protein
MLNGLGYLVTEAWPIKPPNFNTKFSFFKDFFIFHPNQVEAKVANFDKSLKHSCRTSSEEKKIKEEIIVTRCQIWAVGWLFNLYKITSRIW